MINGAFDLGMGNNPVYNMVITSLAEKRLTMYAIKVELKLNNKERTLMKLHAGYSRFVYNYGLELYNNIDHKVFKGGVTKKIGAIKKIFTNVTKKRPEFTWMNELSSKVYQTTFSNLSDVLSRYFKGIAEAPVKKRKKDGDSFTVYDGNGVVVINAGKRIKIPTLGMFRLKEALPCRYVTQTFTLSQAADKWFVSFSVDADKIPPLFHSVTQTVGIDLGVKTFATLSDGTTYSAPKPMKKVKFKLGKLQWRNRKKQLGDRRQGVTASKNAHKYYQRLALHHARIANQRRDFLQKTTTEISKKYAHIRIEDLNVRGMVANHKLSSAIADMGFHEFRRQLTYKAPMFGTRVELVDRWYPSSKTCSRCKHVQPMPLKERVFVCQSCEQSVDRDLGAAINLASAPDEVVRLAQP